MTAPYIGITGIVDDQDVEVIRSLVPLVPSPYRLMAGVLVSSKTLHHENVTSRRYPKIEQVNSLLSRCGMAGAWPVVHFNTRLPLDEELYMLRDDAPSMRGIRLNVVRPDYHKARNFLRQINGLEFILQVNRGSITGDHGLDTNEVSRRIISFAESYKKVASHALVDFSGGHGTELPQSFVWNVLHEWEDQQIIPGIAGGLGPDCESIVRLLTTANPRRPFSVDAESKIRVPVDDPIPGEKHQDRLCPEKARAYVEAVVRGLKAREEEARNER